MTLITYLPLFYEHSTVEQRIKMENDLERFGLKVGSKQYLEMAANAEEVKPTLEQFDAYGKRIDKLHTSEGWKFLKREAAIEKLVAIPYTNNDPNSPDYNPNARLH